MDALSRAREHLEVNTVLPLEQLQQRTQFTEGIIRDVYECQIEILQGSSDGGETVGIVSRLKALVEHQEKLRKKIEAVGETLQRQKNLAASALSVSLSTQAKISHAEKVYATQIRSWQAVYERLQASISSLQQTRSFVLGTSSSPSIVSPQPTPNAKQSPMHSTRGSRQTPSRRRDIVAQQKAGGSAHSPYFATPRRRPVRNPANGYTTPPPPSTGGEAAERRDSRSKKNTCEPVIYLTQEEIEACEQLLGAEVGAYPII